MGHHMSRSVLVVALVAVVGTVVAAIPAHAQTPAAAKKKLLFLTHAALYKHPSLAPAEKAVGEMGRTGGFDVTALESYKQESREDIWSNDAVFRAHVTGGIRWALGLEN
jgi:hypothetical protein